MYPSTTGSSNDNAETYANAPNMSLMNIMYTTTFGNGGFVIQPPSPGEVGDGFPSIPYLSQEAVFYQQQASNPLTAPVNTLSGANVGQQVIQGQYTSSDGAGTSRYMQGFQPSGTSSILNTANNA